ncbi:phytoene desaturase [Candidatus Poribacteria bacterium]|nr:phytoene desaturase [Candidatus Poribacteria bacterium]
MSKKVAVIGGGLGALGGAIRLACMGFDVQLFEKNEKLGGKTNEVVSGSYRFDTGPSLLTMDFVIDELFDFAGFKRSEMLEFVPVDPICRYFFPDGSIMDASADREKMIDEISKLSPEDADSYDEFISYCKDIYDLTADVFLYTPIHEMDKVLKKGNLSTLFKLYKMDPFRSVHQGVSRYFSDPRLIQLFDRYATYSGSDPFKAPATLNIICYVEYGLGGYYVKGGIYRLVEALINMAEELGVEIYTSTKVDEIIVENDFVSGVFADGERFDVDYVLCGADAVVTYNTLIKGYPVLKDKMNSLEPSLSGIVFLWGINKQNPELKHHNIIFSKDYQEEFRQIFDKCETPDDPTIYVSITSKADPEHASSGGENWFVLLNMPYITDDQDWSLEIDRMRKKVLTKLTKTGIDISNNIEFEKVYTPLDFLNLYNSNKGSIYGISSNSRMMAFKRHANRSRQIKGLYFAGGSVHPGGGIPLVLLSGKMAAELIGEDME